MPAPNVDSAVIRLDVNQTSPDLVKDEKFLFSLVRAGFSQRRKTLPNPLSGQIGLSKDQIIQQLKKLSIKPTVRAEEMKFEEWLALSNALFEEIN